jgi:hypothetical protein
MDDFYVEFQCPQCGGTMIPVQTDKDADHAFLRDDIDTPTTNVQRNGQAGSGAPGASKGYVKVAQTVDLGFGGILTATATGPFSKPSGSQATVLQPPKQTGQTQPQFRTQQPGKKKFIISKPGAGNAPTPTFSKPSTPPPSIAPSMTTFPPNQASVQKTASQINTQNTQGAIRFRTPQQAGGAQSPQPQTPIRSPQFQSQPAPQTRPSQPPQPAPGQSSTALKGRLISQPTWKGRVPEQKQENFSVVSSANEQSAIAAEKMKIEADEASRREMILKEAQKIAEEQIRLVHENTDKKIADEKAKFAKKAAEDAEITRKIFEETAKKAALETSAYFSELIIEERKTSELEADKRLKKEMEKFDDLKKSIEETRKKSEDKKPEEAEKKEEKPLEKTEIPNQTQPNKKSGADDETKISEIKTESVKDEKETSPAQPLPELTPQPAGTEKTAGAKTDDTEKKEPDPEKKTAEEKPSSPTKKSLFPDKKKKGREASPFAKFAKKTPPPSGETKDSAGIKAGEEGKDKPAAENKIQDGTPRSQINMPPSGRGITNSGLIRIQGKKKTIIYVLITAGALVVCALIIWIGIYIKKIITSRSSRQGSGIIKKIPLPIQKSSKYKVEYDELYKKIKTMPTAKKSDIDKIIADWENFINKYPEDQGDGSIIEAKKQRDNMKMMRDMY